MNAAHGMPAVVAMPSSSDVALSLLHVLANRQHDCCMAGPDQYAIE